MEIEDQTQSSKNKGVEKLKRLNRLNRERVRKFRQNLYENKRVHQGIMKAYRLVTKESRKRE